MSLRLHRLATALLVCVVPLIGQLEQGSGGGLSDGALRITDEYVLVDAIVTDSDGAPISDLTADEFEITDGGQRQEITQLEYISTGSVPTEALTPAPDGHPGGRRIREPSQVRRSIVFVADTTADPSLLPRVQHMLRDFANRQMQRGDLVALRTLSEQDSALGQFSGERQQLAAAIDRIAWTPAVGPVNEIIHYQAINNAMASLDEMPGRKAIVYISPGFVWYPRDVRDSDRPRIVEQMYNQVADLAQRTGVVFYSIDPVGATSLTRGTSSGSPVESGMGLPRFASPYDQAVRSILPRDAPQRVARESGGFLLHGNSGLTKLLERVLDDLNGYYLIRYQHNHEFPTSEQPTFHKVQVKVTRKGASVRSRGGYYGVVDSPHREPDPGDERLRAALFSPLPADGIPAQVSLLVAAGERNESSNSRPAVLRTLFAVNTEGLPFEDQPDGSRTATMNLAAIAYAADGSVAARDGGTLTIDASKLQESDGEVQDLAFQLVLSIESPGPYVVKTAVTDRAMEKVGSSQAYVEIPDFSDSRLTLFSLIAVDAGQQPLPAAQGEPLSPGNAIERVFRPGSTLRYLCAAVGAEVDPLTDGPSIETEVRLYRGSRQMFASEPVRAATDGSGEETVLGGTMTLPEDLPVGDYALELIAHDRVAGANRPPASQWVRFTLAR